MSQCVWLYFRFALSFRDVEEMLAMRSVSLSYDTVGECLDLSPNGCSKIDVTKVPMTEREPQTSALREKDVKSFLCSTLKSQAHAEFYCLLPFFTVPYHPLQFFLARYWPVGKIGSRGLVLVSYWKSEVYWWSRGGSNP